MMSQMTEKKMTLDIIHSSTLRFKDRFTLMYFFSLAQTQFNGLLHQVGARSTQN